MASDLVARFRKKVRLISTFSHAVTIPKQYIQDGVVVPGQEYQVTLEVVKKVRK